MHVVVTAVLAGILGLAQAPAPQTDRVPPPAAPDCQKLLMTSSGPGVIQLCEGEAEMRRGEAAAADASQRRKHLANAAAEFARAAGSLRDVALQIYAVETLIRLYDDTHLNEPHQVEFALRALIPLMPGKSSPLRRIAAIQEAQGMLDAAENTLLGARQQMPEDVEVYRALSQFYGRRASQMPTDNPRTDRHGEPLSQNVEPAAQIATPVPQAAEPDAEGFYSIGGDIAPPAPTTERVPAVRSREADAAGVSGAVVLEIRVDENGGVSDAKVLRSIPMLDEAAVATVKQWRYAPTLVEGRAVPVKMTVVVNFPPPK
jgi:TonB family protein